MFDISSIPDYSCGMTINKGIRMRIKPNATQKNLLESHFGANRWLWNWFLAKRTHEYQESKKGSTYANDAAELTKLKHDGEHDWLNETSTASLQRTLKHLDTAYRAFFKGRSNFPRFKSRKKGDKSFTLSTAGSGIRIIGKRLKFVNFQEGLRFNRDLPLFTKINNVTISCAPSGKYYASLSVESEVLSLPKTGIDVGIDLGLKTFAIFSDGKCIETPKFTAQYANELKRAQHYFSRKKKGSNRRNKQRVKVAKIYEKIANSRRNFIHQSSAIAIKRYDILYLEDLAVMNMVKNHALAKSISDSGWARFVINLTYKAEWYGKEVHKIWRFYPSSKSCAHCGFINQDLTLSDREWKCPRCETILDRDLNAAVNILAEGRRNFAPAMGENRRGDGVRPKRSSAKASIVETLNPLLTVKG